MTYADQLNILNASYKLKLHEAEVMYEKIQNGLKDEKLILEYLNLDIEFQKEYKYYIDFFTYCVRNIEDLNIQSEFINI